MKQAKNSSIIYNKLLDEFMNIKTKQLITYCQNIESELHYNELDKKYLLNNITNDDAKNYWILLKKRAYMHIDTITVSPFSVIKKVGYPTVMGPDTCDDCVYAEHHNGYCNSKFSDFNKIRECLLKNKLSDKDIFSERFYKNTIKFLEKKYFGPRNSNEIGMFIN